MSEQVAPSRSEPAIELLGVSKAYKVFQKKHTTLKETIIRRGRAEYDLHPVLDRVDLVVPQGQSLGIIGRNGAGKSTILKVIAGLVTPDAGSVTVRGRVSTLLELGAGFQGDYTGEENIYLYAALMGLGHRYVKERFDDIVEFSGIRPYINNMVKTYSSGMYMRLAFAVAVNVDPDLLIIDEVIAVGDQAFQQKSFERTADLRRRGKTIIVVSHDLTSIQRFCDRAIWIENGKIAADGAPPEVVARYVEVVGDETHRATAGAAGQQLRIYEVSLRDGAGDAVDAIRSGEPATVQFTVEAPERVEAMRMSVQILNEEGLLVAVGSMDAHEAMTIEAGRQGYSCRFAALPLTAGSYRVEVGLNNLATGTLAHPPHEPLVVSVLGPAAEGIVAVSSTWAAGETLAGRRESN